MDRRMENLPILQDFVPYWGRCPATAQLQPKNCIKRGKGTADHMPLGDWYKNGFHLIWNWFQLDSETVFNQLKVVTKSVGAGQNVQGFHFRSIDFHLLEIVLF